MSFRCRSTIEKSRIKVLPERDPPNKSRFRTVPPISFSAVRWSSVNLNTSAINQSNPISRTKTQRHKGNPFYPRMALIGTNKTETLAVSLILHHKIKFTAKYSFV